MPVSGCKLFRSLVLTTLALATLAVVAVETDPAKPSPEQIQFFESQVRPILETACFKCHGGEAKIKGGLRLTTRAAILSGGDTGPAISIDQPAKSLLLKAISYKDEDLQMPPKEQLPKEKIATLTKWVEMGAPWPAGEATVATGTGSAPAPNPHSPPKVTPETMKFWSYQPVKRPPVPQVKEQTWVKDPIDNFILQKLEAAGLAHAAPASKTALIRRAYYDLTGLPPKPQEVEAFLNDQSPDAYENVIDRLLASPQYGEKWGRHWLDVVRFAETNSFERDGVKPNAWKYRDYVINAFNNDKPYDQFVREQIAGDELPNATPESIIATGFYRLGAWDDEPSDKLQARYDELDDIVTTVGQGFLGMTMNCCRCHDHKIDPIPQKDYYSLVAFFINITPYANGRNIQTDLVPDAQRKAHEQEVESLARRKQDLRQRIAAFEEPVLKTLSESEKADLDKPRQRATLLEPKILAATNADELRHYKELRTQLKELEDRKESDYPQALSVKETGPTPAKSFVMKRGNANTPGEAVQPAFPEVLNPPKVVLPPAKKGQRTTGLRTQLANWLTSEKNPLTARVIVNRLWEHHFGRGIVRSPNDFGFGGDKPTHPELLDYLASELVASGWHLKAIHKLIMLSNAYQMSSAGNETALAKDPQNDLFWRFDMRRLTAEEFRDAILAVTGKLNPKMGGPGIYPTIPATILAGQSRPGEGWDKSSPEEAARRSVYIHVKRSLVVPIIAAFDAADTDFSCPARFTTTQATQSLMLLNSDMMNDEATAFAKRIHKEAGELPEAQVRFALKVALSREPAPDEVSRGVAFIDLLKTKHHATSDLALKQFALLVLNLNEFVYLD